MKKNKAIFKIDDHRLSSYTKRSRSGSEQIFYKGNDSRDIKRYNAEGQTKMYDKPDTIRINPPEEHYYAELLYGEWWWVNGCAECNGNPRDLATYIECNKHNVCAHCGCSRSELTTFPWSRLHGWICNPCFNKERETEKTKALNAMPEDYDEWDYEDLQGIKCPYCDYEYTDSFIHGIEDETSHDCPRCDNTFNVTAIQSLTFNCSRIE